jgi:hypothetical protein
MEPGTRGLNVAGGVRGTQSSCSSGSHYSRRCASPEENITTGAVWVAAPPK